MAVVSPKLPVFCIVRARWYTQIEVFDSKDWLPKTYPDWFGPATGSPTVPLVEHGPSPLAPGSGGSGGAGNVPDPRIEQLIARVTALENAPGGGVDPRVDELAERVENLRAGVQSASKMADDAMEMAGNASSAASAAKGAVAGVQAGVDKAKSDAGVAVTRATAAGTAAESAVAKANSADGKAVTATNLANQAVMKAEASGQAATNAVAAVGSAAQAALEAKQAAEKNAQDIVGLGARCDDNELTAEQATNKGDQALAWAGDAQNDISQFKLTYQPKLDALDHGFNLTLASNYITPTYNFTMTQAQLRGLWILQNVAMTGAESFDVQKAGGAANQTLNISIWNSDFVFLIGDGRSAMVVRNQHNDPNGKTISFRGDITFKSSNNIRLYSLVAI